VTYSGRWLMATEIVLVGIFKGLFICTLFWHLLLLLIIEWKQAPSIIDKWIIVKIGLMLIN